MTEQHCSSMFLFALSLVLTLCIVCMVASWLVTRSTRNIYFFTAYIFFSVMGLCMFVQVMDLRSWCWHTKMSRQGQQNRLGWRQTSTITCYPHWAKRNSSRQRNQADPSVASFLESVQDRQGKAAVITKVFFIGRYSPKFPKFPFYPQGPIKFDIGQIFPFFPALTQTTQIQPCDGPTL